MKKRDRQRQRKPPHRPASPVPTAPRTAEPGRLTERLGWLVAAVFVIALAATIGYRIWYAPADDGDGPIAKIKPLSPDDEEEPPTPDSDSPHAHKHGTKPGPKDEPDDFLNEFNNKEGKSDPDSGAATLSNTDLEKLFDSLVRISDQLNAVKERAKAGDAPPSAKQYQELVAEFDRKAVQVEKAVGQAREARPDDAVPRWLTGELLMLVGGEPEEYSAHLKFALTHGLNRPRLFGSMALAQLEANQFDEAYQSAVRAMDRAGGDRYVCSAFIRIALCNNRFDDAINRLDRAFPGGAPSWAKARRQSAEELQAQWQAEHKLRVAEARANDLPRVRLLIEHRRFARDADGKPLTTVESTGREEVVLELFENEAPITVANFLDLVSRKFYDGTRLHLVLPASMAAGGDPNTLNNDPDDDGEGGPGYVIPDEYQLPAARSHFRGSLSMVNTGPHTTGSQFFLSLAPNPEMDRHFTVFGRVIEGQDVVDRITRGRTTRKLGHFGRMIPGDLLVRAEVLRKRDHPYEVIKVKL